MERWTTRSLPTGSSPTAVRPSTWAATGSRQRPRAAAGTKQPPELPRHRHHPADGSLRGWLGGSPPDANYHLEFFASAGSRPRWFGRGPGIPGLARGDHRQPGPGRLRRAVRPPAGRPSSRPRRPTRTATRRRSRPCAGPLSRRPPGYFVDRPGQPLVFSAASGDAIAVQDPGVGPLDPAWDLTLSVPAGTLTLSHRGLAGSGDGTGSLPYRGRCRRSTRRWRPEIHTGAGVARQSALGLTAGSEGAAALQAR